MSAKDVSDIDAESRIALFQQEKLFLKEVGSFSARILRMSDFREELFKGYLDLMSCIVDKCSRRNNFALNAGPIRRVLGMAAGYQDLERRAVDMTTRMRNV
jgi:hypothetical protein